MAHLNIEFKNDHSKIKMNKTVLSVRELQKSDINLIIRYWLDSDKTFLVGMGVDVNKIPGKDEWKRMLSEQLGQPIEEKNRIVLSGRLTVKRSGIPM